MKKVSKETTKKDITKDILSDFVTREEFKELERRVSKLEEEMKK
jgi:Trp operon repressor